MIGTRFLKLANRRFTSIPQRPNPGTTPVVPGLVIDFPSYSKGLRKESSPRQNPSAIRLLSSLHFDVLTFRRFDIFSQYR